MKNLSQLSTRFFVASLPQNDRSGSFYEPIRHKIYLLAVLAFSLVLAQSKDLQKEIINSRETAITRAIQEVSPAVAGINVTAIQEYVTSPFFNDPLWNMLFPEQIHRRRVKSLGSGVVISRDGYVVTSG